MMILEIYNEPLDINFKELSYDDDTIVKVSLYEWNCDDGQYFDYDNLARVITYFPNLYKLILINGFCGISQDVRDMFEMMSYYFDFELIDMTEKYPPLEPHKITKLLKLAKAYGNIKGMDMKIPPQAIKDYMSLYEDLQSLLKDGRYYNLDFDLISEFNLLYHQLESDIQKSLKKGDVVE